MKGGNEEVRLRAARALRRLRREVKKRDRELGILAHRLAEYQVLGHPKEQIQYSPEHPEGVPWRAAPYRTLSTELLYRCIAEFATVLKKRGDVRKNIIADAAKEFDVDGRTVEKALKRNGISFR
jgi:hypothetical protein